MTYLGGLEVLEEANRSKNSCCCKERIAELEALCARQREALEEIRTLTFNSKSTHQDMPHLNNISNFALSMNLPHAVKRIAVLEKFVHAYRHEPLTVLKTILDELDELEKE